MAETTQERLKRLGPDYERGYRDGLVIGALWHIERLASGNVKNREKEEALQFVAKVRAEFPDLNIPFPPEVPQ